MDATIAGSVDQLIDAIRTSGNYARYCETMKQLKTCPELYMRVMRLRADTMARYENGTEGDLMENSESLEEEYEALQKEPMANAFLEAEEELVRTLRAVNDAILGCLEIGTP